MSKVREYAVRISNVAYGVLNDKHKVIITFGEEIEERLKRNGIDFIYAEPVNGVEGVVDDYIKFYGYNSKEKGFNSNMEVVPFYNAKFWAKYDPKTHSIRYASKAIVKMFNPFLGEYNNFYDNKLTITDKAKYELFHINKKDRSGYSVVSSRRGSTMSIAPGERTVKLDYDKKAEERIKELANINEEQVDEVKDHDMRAMYPEVEVKSPLKEEVERIKKKITNNFTMTAEEIKKASDNAFLKHHPLDVDESVRDEFVKNDRTPDYFEKYQEPILTVKSGNKFVFNPSTSSEDYELFPAEKDLQVEVENIMFGLEHEMDELQERLNTLVKRYQKLNWVYVALTGHLYGDDLPKELYVMSAEAMPGGKDGETEKSLSDSLPKTAP